MARPTTINGETILAAARAVFLDRGAAATTAEVARRAGTSQGSIFKRYKTKTDLFRAAMKTELDADPPWFDTLRVWRDTPNWRETLNVAGLQMVAFFRIILPLQIMRFSSGQQMGFPTELTGPDSLPLRALKLLSDFFERQIAAGRMRRQDPQIVARIFLGSIQSFVFFETLMRLQDQLPMLDVPYVRGVINCIWKGSMPGEAAKRKKER